MKVSKRCTVEASSFLFDFVSHSLKVDVIFFFCVGDDLVFHTRVCHNSYNYGVRIRDVKMTNTDWLWG